MTARINSSEVQERQQNWIKRGFDILLDRYPDVHKYPLGYARTVPVLLDAKPGDKAKDVYRRDPVYGVIKIVFKLVYEPTEKGPNGEDGKWWECSDIIIYGDHRPTLNIDTPRSRRSAHAGVKKVAGPRVSVINDTGKIEDMEPSQDVQVGANRSDDAKSKLRAIKASKTVKDSAPPTVEELGVLRDAGDRATLLDLCREYGVDHTKRSTLTVLHDRLVTLVSEPV